MYRNWVKPKIPLKFIILLSILALLGSIYVETNKQKVDHHDIAAQLEAARTMRLAMEAIYEAGISQGVDFNLELDPNRTGLIGKEFTPITTTLGNLEAKRTSTNPDFAALFVRYFNELNLKKGDIIAIGGSSSFPGSMLAALSAAEAMELEPLLILSLGSSMYGANLPEFNFLDMLEVLNNQDIISSQPIGISLGGQNDTGAGFENEEILLEIAESSPYPLIYNEELNLTLQERLNFYQASADAEIKTFINIGGSSANIGKTSAYLNLPTGLNKKLSPEFIQEENGVLFEFAGMNIPTIHILNIRELAQRNGIAIDPVPLPRPGESNVYYQVEYQNQQIIIILISIMLLAFFIFKKYRQTITRI